MEQPLTISTDLAKSVFQLYGVDDEGAVVLRRQLRRSQVLAFFQNLPPCLVGMEGRPGCATGSSNRRRRPAPFAGSDIMCA